MAHLDKGPDGGKFRAVAAAGVDATAGKWGDGDLVNVKIDASGTFGLASATDCDGVVLTTEGRTGTTAASYKKLIGGRKYTVFTFAELAEVGTGASPALSAGDKVYAAASGDVEVDAPVEGAIFIGYVMDSGDRMVINVNGKPVAAGGS